uniref:Ig-like domain-containing protein n=1 Tax=Maylandia zebra TaxID=106582 RepID=A0A3P9D9A7_9CICH
MLELPCLTVGLVDLARWASTLRSTVRSVLRGPAQKDNVLQAKGEETAAAGGTVTLDCLYNSSGTNNYLFWYKQDGNNSPKFILSRVSRDDGNTADEFKERFSSTLDSSIRSAPLKIQKLQLSDSAVYYCALQPTVTGNKRNISFSALNSVLEMNHWSGGF